MCAACGCLQLSTLPPPGYKCKCMLSNIPFKCMGELERTQCDLNVPACRNPGFNKETCEYGGGNCGGY